jgi:hypothetical protein
MPKRSYHDRPVKVTAKLAGPLGGPQPPYLDSLCELALAGRAKSIQESSGGHRHDYPLVPRGQPVPREALGKLPIPIKRIHVAGLPVPRASSPIIPSPTSDHAAYYTSAFPLGRSDQLTEKERTKISPGGGRFKSHRLPLRLRVVPRVVWFAVLNDRPGRLRSLLKREIRFLGKKSSQGYCQVTEWLVEPIEEDYSWYAGCDDLGVVLMRPLPAEMDHPPGLCGYRRTFGGCVGPYWQRDFWTEILEPC